MKAEYHEGMPYAEYLAKLKVGDEVVYLSTNRYGTSVRKLTVERFTATQIVTKGGDHYRIANGKLVGGGYCDRFPIPASEELQLKDRQAGLASKMKHVVAWSKLSLETLEAIDALLSKDTT